MGFFFKLRSVAFQAHQQHWFLFYEKSCLYIQFPGFFFSVPQRWNYIRVSKWFPFWGCTISLNWQWLIAALKSFFSKMISHLLPPGKVHQHHLAKLQPHLNQLQYLRKYINTELAAWVNDFHFWMDQSFNMKILIAVSGDYKGKCIFTSCPRVKSTCTTWISSSPT